MNLQHVNVKFFVDGEMPVDLEQVINAFHRWVANQSMDELLIDVADYRHVPRTPSVVLVGHEADYAIDYSQQRVGLVYNDKLAREGESVDRFRHAYRSAVNACLKLEAEFSDLHFSRREFAWSINDRGLAPNSEETFVSCEALMPVILKDVLQTDAYTLVYDRDPRHLFGATVQTETPLDLGTVAKA
ncbi:MAG: hypothetical protein CMJ75_16915 [Planctomycetaceae bacterium]|mgnify:CR=1 FL=1|nr:hypothetical protein [Planctomycetaceae bacterium]